MKKMTLEDLKIKSFVTKDSSVAGGLDAVAKPIMDFTDIPCSAIDACPSAWVCPETEYNYCKTVFCA